MALEPQRHCHTSRIILFRVLLQPRRLIWNMHDIRIQDIVIRVVGPCRHRLAVIAFASIDKLKLIN